MKPNHSENQIKRLNALANLLDKRVRKSMFRMSCWFQGIGSGWTWLDLAKELKSKSCGTAGCAMGWGLTSPLIRGRAESPTELAKELGFGEWRPRDLTDPGTRLFGPHRVNATPKQVAKDIRKYLEDGTLPQA